MKKLIALAFALSCGALMAEDQYLMWMLGTTIELDGESITPSENTVAKIRVGAEGSGDYLSLYGNPGEDAIGPQFGAQDSQGFPMYAGVTGYADDVSFFLELWNDNGETETWVGQSSLGTVAALRAYISDMKFNIAGSGASTSTLPVSSFTAVPEPTSGLLLLLGVAGLALRRKNKKA